MKNIFKKTVLGMTAVAFMTTMTACDNLENEESSKSNSPESNESSGEAQTKGFTIRYPKSLQEDMGKELTMEETPKRVISMTSGPVETLYKMGVEMVAIPDSTITTWAPDLKAEKLPFGMNDVDMEGILALEPDFVILGSGNKEKYGTILESKGIKCYYVKAGPNVTFDDIKEEVRIFGEAFNNEKKSDEILAKFAEVEASMADYKSKNESENMAILFGYPPSTTMSSNSYLGDILSKIGYTNLADNNKLNIESQGSFSLNMEEMINVDPEVLFACSPAEENPSALKAHYTKEFDQNKAMWSGIKAVKNDKIIYLGSMYAKSSGIQVLEDVEKLIDDLEGMK